MKNMSQLFTPLFKFVLVVLTIFLACAFARSSYRMFVGDEQFAGLFVRFPQNEVRYALAVFEGLGAIFILLPSMAVLGASLLVISMGYVLATNLPLTGGLPGYPITLLCLSILLLAVHISFHSDNTQTIKKI